MDRLQTSDLRSYLTDAILPCFIFLGTTILLLAGPEKHRFLWFGFVVLIPIFFVISRHTIREVALTLIALVPIVDYSIVPHFNLKLFDILAVIIIIVAWRHSAKRESSYHAPTGYPFRYLALILVLSSFVSPNLEFSLSIILTYVFFFLVFRGITSSLILQNDMRAVLLCLLVPLLVSAFVGIVQGIYGPYSLAIGKNFNTNVVSGRSGLNRVSGTLDNSLDFAQYLSVMGSFVVGFLLVSWKNSAGGRLLRVVSIVSLTVATIALLGTVSRTSIASFAAVVAFAFIVLFGRKAALLLALVVFLVILFPQEILGLFFGSKLLIRFSGSQNSLQSYRLKIWKNAFDVFLANPILGIGTGNYSTGLVPTMQRMKLGGHVESVWISFLLSNGLLGFAGLVALTVKVLKDSYKLFKENVEPIAKSISFGLFLAFLCNSMNMITNPASLPTPLSAGHHTNFYMFWILLSILFIVIEKGRSEISLSVSDDSPK